MMRYLPGRVRVAIAPAAVAVAAGCGGEISSKPAPVPASAEVIAPNMGLTKAPGYVACTAATDPNSPVDRYGEESVRLGFPGSPGLEQRGGECW